MSKYTTEVRFICEQKAGITESVGANSVDSIIANAWNKIFTTNCTFFDEDYRQVLCSKILKHYYLREISAETVGIWLLWLNTKLEEIMPYYNKLYESALLEFDPFKDVDYTKTHEGAFDGTKDVDGTTTDTLAKTGNTITIIDSDVTTETEYEDNGTIGDARDITVNSEAHSEGQKSDRYSDTPQGTINNTDVTGDAYLTNVRILNDETDGTSEDTTLDNNLQTRDLDGSSNTTESKDETNTTNYSETNNNSGTSSSNEVVSNTDSYVDRVFGKMSTMPYSELLQKFRDTIINIDLLVIEEFDELFLRLW